MKSCLPKSSIYLHAINALKPAKYELVDPICEYLMYVKPFWYVLSIKNKNNKVPLFKII